MVLAVAAPRKRVEYLISYPPITFHSVGVSSSVPMPTVVLSRLSNYIFVMSENMPSTTTGVELLQQGGVQTKDPLR
jgi:hypothetical protein